MPSYWPAVRYGGPIRSVHGLCAGLAAIGHRVEVLTTNIDGLGTSPVPLDQPIERDGVLVHYFKTGLGRRIYRSPTMAAALRLKVPDADLVHIHAVYLWPGYAAARIARRAHVPYIVSPRGMLVPELIRQKSSLIKRLWINVIERRTLAQALAIHVTSLLEADGIRKLGLDLSPLIEVPNGVQGPDRAPSQASCEEVWCGVPEGARLLYFGRLSWKKGINRLIMILTRLPEVHLYVAGNDDEGIGSELSRLADQLGVSQRVQLLGHQEGRKKWALLAGADLLALPSVNENFGIVVLEALAVGTPVVVSPTVGAAEIVTRHSVGVVAPSETESLATAIGGLLASAERRDGMGMRGKLLVRESYSWHAVAQRMAEVYRAGLLDGAS